MEWQPIETAPRDGTLFDIWISTDTGGYRVTDVFFDVGGKLRRGGSVIYGIPSWPTHWMPLPTPPEQPK